MNRREETVEDIVAEMRIRLAKWGAMLEWGYDPGQILMEMKAYGFEVGERLRRLRLRERTKARTEGKAKAPRPPVVQTGADNRHLRTRHYARAAD
jgi:hypothetical protein